MTSSVPIGPLKLISPYLKRSQREIYYKAVIKPVILYGANIWTSTSKRNINRIFKLQKRAARIISDAEPRSRSVPLFNTLNWIPFYHESYAIRCSLLLKRILGKTPVYLKQMLKLNSDTHNRNTRFSNLNFNCLGAGSRQYCRFTKSPLGITPLKETWEPPRAKEN